MLAIFTFPPLSLSVNSCLINPLTLIRLTCESVSSKVPGFSNTASQGFRCLPTYRSRWARDRCFSSHQTLHFEVWQQCWVRSHFLSLVACPYPCYSLLPSCCTVNQTTDLIQVKKLYFSAGLIFRPEEVT